MSSHAMMQHADACPCCGSKANLKALGPAGASGQMRFKCRKCNRQFKAYVGRSWGNEEDQRRHDYFAEQDRDTY